MADYEKSHLIDALKPDVVFLQEVAKKHVASGDHPFAIEEMLSLTAGKVDGTVVVIKWNGQHFTGSMIQPL